MISATQVSESPNVHIIISSVCISVRPDSRETESPSITDFTASESAHTPEQHTQTVRN